MASAPSTVRSRETSDCSDVAALRGGESPQITKATCSAATAWASDTTSVPRTNRAWRPVIGTTDPATTTSIGPSTRMKTFGLTRIPRSSMSPDHGGRGQGPSPSAEGHKRAASNRPADDRCDDAVRRDRAARPAYDRLQGGVAMTDLLERPGVLEQHPPTLKRGPQVPPPATPPRRRFLRWMGWMVVLAAVAAIVAYGFITLTDEPSAPVLADIDPRLNPEVVLQVMPSLDSSGPRLANIHPRVSPQPFLI